MATIDVQIEREVPKGWSYHVVVTREGGATSEHEVRLAWVDHDHWSGGRCAPSRVVEALLGLMVEHAGERPLPSSFDAATARRLFPGLDAEMPARI